MQTLTDLVQATLSAMSADGRSQATTTHAGAASPRPTSTPCSASGRDLLARAGLDPDAARFGGILDLMLADAMPQGRGWVMAGPTGCGKSARARLAAKCVGIRIRTADAMVMQAAADGAGEGAVLDAGCLGLGRFAHRQEVNDLVIDDLGRETQEVVLWGTRRDIMREILERRLDAWPHIRTYATTNLTEAELEARYGGRVASRLAQAAMLLRMPARDWRRAEAEKFGWGM